MNKLLATIFTLTTILCFMLDSTDRMLEFSAVMAIINLLWATLDKMDKK